MAIEESEALKQWREERKEIINNDFQERLDQYREEHNTCFIGKSHYSYTEIKDNKIHNIGLLTEYVGQKINKEEYDFIIPCKDDVIIELIQLNNKPLEEIKHIPDIRSLLSDRIRKLNGRYL